MSTYYYAIDRKRKQYCYLFGRWAGGPSFFGDGSEINAFMESRFDRAKGSHNKVEIVSEHDLPIDFTEYVPKDKPQRKYVLHARGC